MAGRLPQRPVDELRRMDLDISGVFQSGANVSLDDPIQRPALGVPEGAADGDVLEVKQAHLAPQAAMVAALGLFEPEEVFLELRLLGPGGAVYALEHGVARIAAPIGAGQLHQLEGHGELAGRGQMRPPAEVDEPALTVERDLLALRQALDDLGLVELALVLEERDRLVPVPDLAADRLVALDDLAHAPLDLLEVLGREGRRAGEIVVKAVLDRRPDGHLGVGVELLDRLGHDVGGVVANDLERIVMVTGDDLDPGVIDDRAREIPKLAVDANGEGGLGQAGADGGGDIGARNRSVEFTHVSVGKGNGDHQSPCGSVRCIQR